MRAKVATASDITEFDRRMGGDALGNRTRQWRAVHSGTGWLTTYTYRDSRLDAAALAHPWCWQADGVIQNFTLFPDGTATATVTIRTSKAPLAPPSTALRTMPGEQVSAAALNMCVPRMDLKAPRRVPVPDALVLPIGPSGVLIGKDSAGGRVLLPLRDALEASHIHIAAADNMAKRLVIRLVGSGERVTLHTNDIERWKPLRMPNLIVTDSDRPAQGTTISIVDGSVSPTPRPRTILSLGMTAQHSPRADVVVEQTGSTTLRIHASGISDDLEMEMFRVEDRYVRRDATVSLRRDN
jgi:hypothetical protein